MRKTSGDRNVSPTEVLLVGVEVGLGEAQSETRKERETCRRSLLSFLIMSNKYVQLVNKRNVSQLQCKLYYTEFGKVEILLLLSKSKNRLSVIERRKDKYILDMVCVNKKKVILCKSALTESSTLPHNHPRSTLEDRLIHHTSFIFRCNLLLNTTFRRDLVSNLLLFF